MKEKKKEKELKCGSLPTADIVGAVGKMIKPTSFFEFELKPIWKVSAEPTLPSMNFSTT